MSNLMKARQQLAAGCASLLYGTMVHANRSVAIRFHSWWTYDQCAAHPNWCVPFAKSILAETVAGRISCDARDFVQKSLLANGVWEQTITTTVRALLREGDVFVDVGANIGYFSLLASQVVGSEGRVYAIEPLPSNLAALLSNIRLNARNNIVILSVAASDMTGIAQLFFPDNGNLGQTAMRKVGHNSVPVHCSPLDVLAGINGFGRIRLFKIDVEGAELKVLLGMHGILSSGDPPFVICELTDEYLRELRASTTALLDFMRSLDFEVFVTSKQGSNKWCPLGKDELAPTAQCDAIFVPASKIDEFTSIDINAEQGSQWNGGTQRKKYHTSTIRLE